MHDTGNSLNEDTLAGLSAQHATHAQDRFDGVEATAELPDEAIDVESVSRARSESSPASFNSGGGSVAETTEDLDVGHVKAPQVTGFADHGIEAGELGDDQKSPTRSDRSFSDVSAQDLLDEIGGYEPSRRDSVAFDAPSPADTAHVQAAHDLGHSGLDEGAISAQEMQNVIDYDPVAPSPSQPAPPTQLGSVAVSGQGNTAYAPAAQAAAPKGLFARLRAAVSKLASRVSALVGGASAPATPQQPTQTAPGQHASEPLSATQGLDRETLQNSQSMSREGSSQQLDREATLERARERTQARDDRGRGGRS